MRSVVCQAGPSNRAVSTYTHVLVEQCPLPGARCTLYQVHHANAGTLQCISPHNQGLSLPCAVSTSLDAIALARDLGRGTPVLHVARRSGAPRSRLLDRAV